MRRSARARPAAGVAFAVGAMALAIVACGARQTMVPSAPSAASTAEPTPAAPEARPHSPEDDQIAELAREIDDQRVRLALPAPHAAYGNPQVVPASAGSAEPVAPAAECHPGTSSTCEQSCTLSSSICDNARKICALASQLPGDDWAAKKCSEGNQTCSAARAQCCGCTP